MTGAAGGEAEWEVCTKKCAYLASHVYKDPPGSSPPTSYVSGIWSQVETEWEYWEELRMQNPIGLVGNLYKQKDWEPGGETNLCPPVLCFRGTDADDLRGLGFAAWIKFSKPLPLSIGTVEIPIGLAVDLGGIGRYQRALPEVPAWLGAGTVAAVELIELGRRLNEIFGTRSGMISEGWTATRAYRSRAEVPRAGGVVSPIIEGMEIEIGFDFLTHPDGGDWYNNLNQGLGNRPPQYVQAMRWAERMHDNVLLPNEVDKVGITGHSLGGGLASAVAHRLVQYAPDLRQRCVVFNAAGLHEATVPGVPLRAARVTDFTVRDEFLTTVQSYANTIPLVGAILTRAAAETGLAPPPACPATPALERHRGIGPPGSDWAGRQVPILFPLDQQTLNGSITGGDYKVIPALESAIQTAGSAGNAAVRFFRWFHDEYYAPADEELGGGTWREWLDPLTLRDEQVLVTALYRLIRDAIRELGLVADLLGTAVAYHGMDYVIPTMERVYGRPR